MMELAIHLRTKDAAPMYEQIYEYFKGEIEKGGIEANEKLPSARALAGHLQVSRSTVDLAYDQLVAEGYIQSFSRKGYFVCELEGLYQIEKEKTEDLKEQCKAGEAYEIDFSPNTIDLEAFPFSIWKKLSKETLSEDKRYLFQSGDKQGEYSFRKTISRYLHQARGVNCSPKQIIIGAGNDYLLFLLGMMLGNGVCTAMENPTYKQAYRVFQSIGFDVKSIPFDAYGMVPKCLEQAGAEIAYVMPSHQFPLGAVMPMKRRLELLKWAGGQDGRYVIEDDYDSEFRYKGKPIPALQGMDPAGRVIYIGTFSKSLAPSIRISYMVLPETLTKLYEEQYKFMSATVSRTDQMLLECFMREGYYERHLNRTRKLYKTKHDKLLAGLKELCSVREIFGDQAGVHLRLLLKNGMSESEAVAAAKQQGVKVYGMSEYMFEGVEVSETNIVIGYGGLSEREIEKGITKLKKAWG